jgi:sortase A
MALYLYTKENNSKKRKMVNYVSYVSLTIGAIMLFWSFYPIISFEIYSRLFMQRNLMTPVPKTEIASSLEKANSILGSYTIFSSNLRDFTQAHLWFPTKSNARDVLKQIKVKQYTLSIPKVNITDASVEVGGDDLSRTLIQYLPETLPGEYGNVIIFGHSTLPQLYNVKDYKTIFTYLPSLEKGNSIILKVGEATYEYIIFDMVVVNPDQVSVLEQKKDAPYLTLITCVPPGTYWKRLVVKAKLTKLPDNVF